MKELYQKCMHMHTKKSKVTKTPPLPQQLEVWCIILLTLEDNTLKVLEIWLALEEEKRHGTHLRPVPQPFPSS